MTFTIPINVKMPTIVGILIFISMINAISESLKARKKILFFQHFNFNELFEHEKSFITSESALTSLCDDCQDRNDIKYYITKQHQRQKLHIQWEQQQTLN